ncbi:alpha/beta hydrolase [Jiangella asiatica]|uniref:Peptidase n=1 Tax=Jiangella asiatica TaxID=2530372 RepID=A0A4R5D3Y1_9ACTN|nr:alpha/beta hydrolase [Jiangella asiatica]TDE08092.1 peptidase [Jiangella asiatica]
MSLDERTGAQLVPRRWPRRMAVGSAAVAGLTLATTGAGGWYFADELLRVRPEPPEFPLRVLETGASSITLSGDDADHPGVIGLHWPGGYARAGGDVTVDGDGVVVRGLVPYPDRPEAGTQVRIDSYAAPADLVAFAEVSGLKLEESWYDGPLGRYPATLVPAPSAARGAPGPADRWVVHVHGRGATRAEAHRLIPALHRLGHPQLSIAYRNDDGAPGTPQRAYGLGWTEAADLAAAVDDARGRGARDVVLVGYSMGGAIVGNYLRTQRREGTDDIAGVVYDSPALSWPDILVYQARQRGLPSLGATVAGSVVRARTGINVWAMDQVVHADELDVPVLLVHGADDPTVPVTSSDAFAAARPDLVTYLRTQALHVQSWNRDPRRYEATLAAFLADLP